VFDNEALRQKILASFRKLILGTALNRNSCQLNLFPCARSLRARSPNAMFNLKRIPNEPAEAYSALSRYLALGPKRCLKALSAELQTALPKLRGRARAFSWADPEDEAPRTGSA
jgi:hypothetical protein